MLEMPKSNDTEKWNYFGFGTKRLEFGKPQRKFTFRYTSAERCSNVFREEY